LIKLPPNGFILNSFAFFEQKGTGFLIMTIEAVFPWHRIASYLQGYGCLSAA
jgi:hypothetical protein